MKKQKAMEALRIEILNPKVKNILKQLADLDLITISKIESTENKLSKLLDKIRSNAGDAPSLEEITQEVESVRAERYAKNQKG